MLRGLGDSEMIAGPLHADTAYHASTMPMFGLVANLVSSFEIHRHYAEYAACIFNAVSVIVAPSGITVNGRHASVGTYGMSPASIGKLGMSVMRGNERHNANPVPRALRCGFKI